MKTYVACDLSEEEADNIRQVLEHLEQEGHFVADVRHEQITHIWRVLAHDRRSHEVLTINRRRETD